MSHFSPMWPVLSGESCSHANPAQEYSEVYTLFVVLEEISIRLWLQEIVDSLNTIRPRSLGSLGATSTARYRWHSPDLPCIAVLLYFRLACGPCRTAGDGRSAIMSFHRCSAVRSAGCSAMNLCLVNRLLPAHPPPGPRSSDFNVS